MEQEPNYESGIYGKAEVRFGGKIAIDVVGYQTKKIHGIALAEFYQKGTVGQNPPTQQHHEPQVFLIFDNMKSVEMLEAALMTVRENIKRDIEAEAGEPQPPKQSPEVETLLDQRLVNLDFKVRTLNILHAANVDTVRELVRLNKTDLLKLRHAGKHTLWEIDDFIKDNNLQWGMKV